MMRSLLALVPFALMFAACGEVPTDVIGGDPATAPEVELPELPTCGEDGVPVILSATADWDDEFPDWIAVEIHGLSCGVDVRRFEFQVFDAEDRNITGRAWPEDERVETDGETFVLRASAAGCGQYHLAHRIEVGAANAYGRCNPRLASAPVSVDVPPFEAAADH